MEYYYTDLNNQTRGPVSLEELRSLADAGRLNASCMIAAVGSQQWIPIASIIPTVAPPAVRQTEPLAIWSFVLSLVGFFCCGLIGWIPAVICGHLALSRMGKNPNLEGKGLATAGLIIGYAGALLWFLWIVFWGGIALLGSLAESVSP